jgi:hypothetical protein
MLGLESEYLDQGHGQIILGAGLVDSSLVEEVGLIGTIDLPICGISSLERILIRYKLDFPTWLHLKAPDENFESFLRNKFPNIVGFSYSASQSEEGLRISALVSIKEASQHFSSIDLVFADTWQDPPEGTDSISVQHGSIKSAYTGVKRAKNRKLEFEANAIDPSVTGYFRISNPQLFLRSLQAQVDNGEVGFYKALTDYDGNLEGEIKLEVAQNWYDFGHTESFYESRRHWLFGRSFNSITPSCKSNRITKSSINEKKLIQEFNWYKKLPPEILQFTPEVWRIDGKSSYEIEFFPAPTLAEILVFGNMPVDFWDNTMIAIENYLSRANAISFNEINGNEFKNARKEMYIDKVLKRIESLRISPEFNAFVDTQNPFLKKLSFKGRELPKLDEVLEIYVSLVNREILAKEQNAKLMHGDLCFGNMIFKNNALKVFDPRGAFGEIELAGDIYYDYAKLAHSIFGEYDYFAFDRYILNRNRTGYETIPIKKGESKVVLEKLRSNFSSMILEHGIEFRKVQIIMAGLFLSLASLHKESAERQTCFLMIGMSEVVNLIEAG